MSKFAERLKELRQEQNLSQRDLAKATKIAQGSISGYESGTNRPSDEVIITFCKFFKVSSDFMLGLSDE